MSVAFDISSTALTLDGGLACIVSLTLIDTGLSIIQHVWLPFCTTTIVRSNEHS